MSGGIDDTLARLADLYDHRAVIESNRKVATEAILSPVAIDLAVCNARYDEEAAAVKAAVEALEAEAREVTLAMGRSVGNGGRVVAVYRKASETWDANLLRGYALAHPDVLGCKRPPGVATVSFRVNGNKEAAGPAVEVAREFGSAKRLIASIAPDFDAPVDMWRGRIVPDFDAPLDGEQPGRDSYRRPVEGEFFPL